VLGRAVWKSLVMKEGCGAMKKSSGLGGGPEEASGRGQVRMRLIRENDVPASHEYDEAFVFGLQDTKQSIVAGERQPDGRLFFDFSLQTKGGTVKNKPVFTGRFASGTLHDRFVYLSWRSIPRAVYINRVKARLGGIDWKMVRSAQAADRPLVADMTGWRPGDPRKQVEWRLG
jgi:hypothetical protein